MNKLKYIILLFTLSLAAEVLAVDIPTSARAEKSITSVESALKKELSSQGLKYGAPIFIRIFKDPGLLEVWVESADGDFVNF